MRRATAPRLDDRSFDQLRAEAIERIRATCPEWTDFSPSDPGIALAEVFAYLTQTLLYRLNRVPDKQYRAFLALLGVRELPPTPATVELVFSRTAAEDAVEIPRGTAVAADAVVFSTIRLARLEAGQTEVAVTAFHGELVENEVLALASGAPGLELTVGRAPIVAPMEDHLDLVVAVEEVEAIPPDARALRFGEATFRIWNEVESFAEIRPGERAYVVDRVAGVIRFPPSIQIDDERGTARFGEGAFGAVPAQGRRILASYRIGGGAAGNVRPGVLTALKTRIPGLTVTNPRAAAGGRDTESLERLLVRGPTDFHRLERAVTARDYETLARRAGGIARAKAFTQAEVWRHAPPGVVEVLLVPSLDREEGRSLEALEQREAPAELVKVQRAIDAARPLGSGCVVRWSKYKPVSVRLRAVVSRQEDLVAVRSRILDRLDRLITPLPRSAWDEGWVHGRGLRRYDIEGTVRAEPGVLYVTDVTLAADRMPEGDIGTVAVDAHQPRTWYIGSGNSVYRTTNGGDGWELVKAFPAEPAARAETVLMVRASPFHPGHVVAVVQVGTTQCRAYISRDAGESWEPVVFFQETVARDVAWADRSGTPFLFVATDGGLYELLPGSGPLLVEVDPAKPNRGFAGVVVHTDVKGITYVAAATNDKSGVYLSRNGGASQSFASVGLAKGIIELGVQRDGVRSYVWAGFASPDVGAARYSLDQEPPKEGWVDFIDGWGEAGSCLAFGFLRDGRVVAGSHSHGVLWLEPRIGAAWQRPSLDSGLPIRDEMVEGEKRLLHPVRALRVDTSTARPELDRIVAGTGNGVYRAPSPDGRYEAVTDRAEFGASLREVVTLPPTWLFCSGTHEVRVTAEGDPGGDE